ncbi:unnamed protein product [Rotaria sp. Silwood2]|nr:unnamed protein product [Rotaria sp. Silwood2]CAF2504563.1 unnamed protein product [Rotaria sp. Silwood2]CAF2735567.1 unnamed protein product [Rotaria sp. Silwood2]CAF2902863.1 unnamed protein product [Rotaria sp. Silwood2]
MEKDLNMAKQFIMYTNDAVEATFSDGMKIFLAPCATEYVVQQGNHTQGLMTTKHRTIYTTSTLLPHIRSVLIFRNLYAQQPFLVPALVDSNQCYQSAGTATHVRWSPNVSLPTISNNDPTQTWSWTSLCGRARIDIPQCRQIIYITHPLQVSRILTKQENDIDIPTKYIHIFAPVRRCFSCQKLPDYLCQFVHKCLQLIEQLSNNQTLFDIEDDNENEWSFKLPLPLPSSSCSKAHRHRLHHEMMFEADIHILQTTTVTYKLEYENLASIEAFVIDENNEHLIDYVITSNIQSSFYNYYSIKDKHALPPHNERLVQIIRFMSTMRQRLLSMTRRVQERPCWMQEDVALDNNINDNIEQLKLPSLENEIDDNDNILRQTSIAGVGHFKYFHDNHVQIKFSNDFILNMTSEQVHSCQMNPYVDFQCRITDKKKQTTIDIFDGITQPGCYEQYITAAIDWCMWIWNEKRIEDQRNLANDIQEELFRLKLYRNRIEIKEYQQSTTINTPIKNQVDYYSPDDIKQILDRTAKFTRTHSS